MAQQQRWSVMIIKKLQGGTIKKPQKSRRSPVSAAFGFGVGNKIIF